MNFCYKTADVWQFVGQIIFILKILIPIVIIVFGMVDLGRAVMDSDEKIMSKALKLLFKRIIIGIAIFFVPILVKIVFGMILSFSEEMKNDAWNCITCLTDPYNETDCDTSYEGEIFKK